MYSESPKTTLRSQSAWMAAPLGGLVASTAVLWSQSSASWSQLPPRYRVVGSLYSSGQPAENAVLAFHPLDRTLAVHPQALVDGAGQFEVRTPYFGAGAPQGTYAVTVQWRPNVADGEHYGPGPNIVDTAYADPARTPLRVAVEPRINQLDVWTVPRRSTRHID